MARQRGAVPDRFDRGVDRAAGFVTEHHQEGRMKDRNGIFEARDDVGVEEVAGHPAHEQIAAGGIEGIFRRHARIGAAENARERILSLAQGFALMLEIVPPGYPLDIALIAHHQALERRIGRQDVFLLGRRLGRRGEAVAGERKAGHCRPAQRQKVTPRNGHRMDSGGVGASVAHGVLLQQGNSRSTRRR
jgi:hypothetical protein